MCEVFDKSQFVLTQEKFRECPGSVSCRLHPHWTDLMGGCRISPGVASMLSIKPREYEAFPPKSTKSTTWSVWIKRIVFFLIFLDLVVPLRQKLSCTRPSLLPVTTEDALIVLPSNWEATRMVKVKQDKSRHFLSSQCCCLGVTGGTRKRKKLWWDWREAVRTLGCSKGQKGEGE